MKNNYYVRDDCDGNPQLTRCSPQGGYPTVAAAKEAEIKEVSEKTRFDVKQLMGFSMTSKELKSNKIVWVSVVKSMRC